MVNDIFLSHIPYFTRMEFELVLCFVICHADESGRVFRFHAGKMLGLLPVAFLVSECPRSTFLMRVMDKLAV